MDEIARTALWFEKAKPEPTNQDFSVQLGVDIEEIGEMYAQLRPLDAITEEALADFLKAAAKLGELLKEARDFVGIHDRIEFLDGVCDRTVTGIGSAVFAGMNVHGAMTEVNDSNFSKFVNGQPIFHPNGKIKKGENYFKPVLKPFTVK